MPRALAVRKSIFARALHMVSCLKQLAHHTSGNATIYSASRIGLPRSWSISRWRSRSDG